VPAQGWVQLVQLIGRAAAWFVAVALWSAPMSVCAKVGSFTGEDYLRLCTTTDLGRKPEGDLEGDMDRDIAIYCAGYIEAAVTLIVLMDKQSFCMPADTTVQDLLKATVASMQAHPDQRQYPLANVMVAAIQAQWPCRPT
jgi:hypothetical protein